MELGLLFGLLLILMLIRVPIAFSLAISSVVTAIILKIPLMFIFQRMVNGLNTFTFLAVPFFILSAQIMTEGGISDKLIKFANVFVGRIRGGTALVNVITSMFFGGVSGSSVADVSSIGSFLIPAMEKEGYDKDYSVAVTVTSSIQGVIIPPSQNMIYYSIAIGGISISKLFLAGYIPGILLGLLLMLVTYILALKRSYPKKALTTTLEKLKVVAEASVGLFTIVIIMGGILTGIFTATESAAVAAVWAILVTGFIYRTMNFKKLLSILLNSSRTLAQIVAIISASSAFGFILSYLKVPVLISNFFLSISDNPIIIMALVNVALLILGMFMDMGVLILLVSPIFLPVVTRLGYDPLHFGIILILNLGLGLCTPPVGTSLFVGCAIAKTSIEKTLKAFVPFYITILGALVLIIVFPQLSLWLPNLYN